MLEGKEVIVISIVSLLLPGLLFVVPTAEARTLTVPDAISLALQNGETIAAAEAGHDKALADQHKSLLALFPKVSAQGMYRYQTPLPEMTWDLAALSGGGAASSTASCDSITKDQVPEGWTLELAQQMCQFIMGMMSAGTSTEPTTVTIGYNNNWTAQLAVDQVIFAGFALHNAYAGARDMTRASAEQVRQARHEAAYAAEQAFYGLYLAREAQKVTTEAVGLMDAYVKDLGNVVSVGIGSQADLLAAKAQQSRTQLEAMKTEHMAHVAELAFRASLGLPANETIELTLPGDAVPTDVPEDAQQLLSLALQKRPELGALRATGAALGHYGRASWSSWVPTVALDAAYMGQRPNPYTAMLDFSGTANPTWYWSTNISVIATWSLWDQGSAIFGHAATAASRRQLQAQQRLVEEMLPVEVESALSSYKESQAAVEVARVGLTQSEEAFRLEQDRFKQGMANNTQLLSAQSALSGARLALLQAETTVHMSHAALRKAAGLDPEVSP
jgi:outer membrane protein